MISKGVDMTRLTQNRLITASREDVFRAWTEPSLLARWWWPARFQTTYEIDLRPRGKWRFYTVDTTDRGVLAIHGVYRVVEPPHRLQYTWKWEGMDDEPESLVTVVFNDRDGKTEVVVTHEGLANEQRSDDHAQGWSDCLDRLVQIATTGDITGLPVAD